MYYFPERMGMQTVALVGGTGNLGGLTLRALLARGKSVRAIVRPGSDISEPPRDTSRW